MTDQPLSAPVRDTLLDHVESDARSGDFEALWQRAHTVGAASRPSLVPPLALAAAAVLVVGLAAGQAARIHAGGALGAPTPAWEEPVPLRFPVAAPAADAMPHVRIAVRDASDAAWARAAAATPADQQGALELRRALTSLHHRDLDTIREHGVRSNTAVGSLLASEVHLVDLETARAATILGTLREDSEVGPIATRYLALLDQGATGEGLAEVSALALLGDVPNACRHAPELWPETTPEQRAITLQLAPALAACVTGG
ncbi:MAG: hypothetical protein R3F61_11820 [Myxococcota bacterium]